MNFANIFNAGPAVWVFVRCLLLVSLLGGCSGLFFYPYKTLIRTPSDINVDYEDIRLVAKDGVVLHAWYLLAPEPKATLLFLHGNAENISTHIGSVYWLPKLGFNVLMLDYRGYGLSEGTPKLPDVFLDVEAAMDWLVGRSKEDELPLFFFGQSLGASLGVSYFGSDDKNRQLIELMVLDSPFTGYSDIASDMMTRHWITSPLSMLAQWVLPSDYDPSDVITNMAGTPILIMHSENDAVVPFSHGVELFKVAGEPKDFLRTEGDHIRTFSDPVNRKYFIDFVGEYLLKK